MGGTGTALSLLALAVTVFDTLALAYDAIVGHVRRNEADQPSWSEAGLEDEPYRGAVSFGGGVSFGGAVSFDGAVSFGETVSFAGAASFGTAF